MRYYTRVGELEREYRFERQGGRLVAHCNGQTFDLDLSMVGDGTAFSLSVDGRSYDCLVERSERAAVVQMAGERILVEVEDERERAAHRVAGPRTGGRRSITSVMPGVVVDVVVGEGQLVEEGQTLLVLEAMKMQNPIQADGAGRVARVAVARGDAVARGALLVELDAADAGAADTADTVDTVAGAGGV